MFETTRLCTSVGRYGWRRLIRLGAKIADNSRYREQHWKCVLSKHCCDPFENLFGEFEVKFARTGGVTNGRNDGMFTLFKLSFSPYTRESLPGTLSDGLNLLCGWNDHTALDTIDCSDSFDGYIRIQTWFRGQVDCHRCDRNLTRTCMVPGGFGLIAAVA